MKTIRLVSLISIVLLFVCSAAFAQSRVTVAVDQFYPPFSSTTPSGEPAGLIIDIWKEWSKQTGTEVQFVSATWSETLQMVAKGDVDIHSGLFKNRERDKNFRYAAPIYSISSSLFHLSGIPGKSYNNITGKKVGVLKSSFQQAYISDNFPSAKVVVFDTHVESINALLRGAVDAIFDETPTVERELSIHGWQGLVSAHDRYQITNKVYPAVSNKNVKMLEAINAGFDSIEQESLSEIEKRWIHTPSSRYYQLQTNSSNIHLTREEKDYINTHRTISLVSTPNWPPFEMEMPDGSYAGIAADFIRLAASKVGITINPVFDTNWGAHVEKLKNGKLDIAPGLNKTEKRLKDFIFTEPYIEYYSAIFTKSDNTSIKTPSDLKERTVALEEGYAIARNLPTERPDINILLVKTTQNALEAVSSGKADAYIGNQVVASYLIKKFTLPNLKLVSLWKTNLPGQLRFAVKKDNLMLHSVMQKGLDSITREESKAILSTYLDASGFQQKIFSLTQDQWDFLKQHPTLHLGINAQNAPFEFMDETGEYKGISMEFINFIKDKLKVTVSPVSDIPWDEVIDGVGSGSIDIISAISPTPKRMEKLLFTRPYIEFPVVIFSQKGAPLINGLKSISGNIGVVRGSAVHELINADFPQLKLTEYPNVNDAVQALSIGESDWLINDIASGSYTIEKNGIANLKVASSTSYTLPVSIAVSKDNHELLTILNKALDVITEDQTSDFKSKWLALKFEHGLDFKTVLKWGAPILAGFLLIIGIIVAWNRKMGSEISQRKKAQAELNLAMSSLDEKNNMLEGLSSKLAKYLSPQVYQSIFSGDRDVALSTERKKLTVFFSDIKDFTQTTDDMQPEDLTALLNNYFTEMSAIALEYGATIDKFIGDAMLMFFGDPETKGVKKDAEQCVRMALAMQHKMQELEKRWRSMGYDKPFKMRIGINTGYCNVGNFGSESRMDYTIIGGEVNLAARLEGQADPGGLLISSETYSLVKDIINAEERQPISVKGIRRSIRPYAVLSLSDGSAREAIVHQGKGVDLYIDANDMNKEEKTTLAKTLNEIASKLTS